MKIRILVLSIFLIHVVSGQKYKKQELVDANTALGAS